MLVVAFPVFVVRVSFVVAFPVSVVRVSLIVGFTGVKFSQVVTFPILL